MKRDKFSTMIRGYRFIFITIICFAWIQCSQPDQYVTAPLKTTDGRFIGLGDPFVYQHETYYMTGTSVPDSGFNYYTSTDLITWEFRSALPSLRNHYGKGYFWHRKSNLSQQVLSHLLIPVTKQADFFLPALAVSDNWMVPTGSSSLPGSTPDNLQSTAIFLSTTTRNRRPISFSVKTVRKRGIPTAKTMW